MSVLKQELGISGSKAKALLDTRSVWVNGRRVWMAKHRLSARDRVEVRGHRAAAAPPQVLEVLFEDKWILAVNKPAGIVSESHSKSVESLLRSQTGNRHLRALHRLDRDTSGCLLFSKSPDGRDPVVDLFRDRAVQKEYTVLLAGTLPAGPVEVNRRIKGKEAHSIFHRQKTADGFCRARCEILTGRTHQIRIHAGSLGCRVLGDPQYQQGPEVQRKEKKVPRQMLHADSIAFSSPHSGKPLHIRAPWPDDFQTATHLFGLT